MFPQRSIFERVSFAVNLLQRHSFWFLPRLSIRCPVIHFRCGRHDDATRATRPHETILLVSTSRSNRYSSSTRSLCRVSRPLGLSFSLYVPDSSLATQQSPMLSSCVLAHIACLDQQKSWKLGVCVFRQSSSCPLSAGARFYICTLHYHIYLFSRVHILIHLMT